MDAFEVKGGVGEGKNVDHLVDEIAGKLQKVRDGPLEAGNPLPDSNPITDDDDPPGPASPKSSSHQGSR